MHLSVLYEFRVLGVSNNNRASLRAYEPDEMGLPRRNRCPLEESVRELALPFAPMQQSLRCRCLRK
jgi:hypothetical protein